MLQTDPGTWRTLKRRIVQQLSESGCCRRTSSTVVEGDGFHGFPFRLHLQEDVRFEGVVFIVEEPAAVLGDAELLNYALG
jgi:hypothetical protein